MTKIKIELIDSETEDETLDNKTFEDEYDEERAIQKLHCAIQIAEDQEMWQKIKKRK